MSSRTARERTILQAYVGLPTPADALAAAIESLSLEGQEYGKGYPTLLDAAVADVLLNGSRTSEPQGSERTADAETLLARLKTRNRRARFRPVHILSLDWAVSGPGFSWPMFYYVTPVPEFRRLIVTASADGTDVYGFCAFVIGSFAADVPPFEAVREVIVSTWTRQAASGQRRWSEVFAAGLVTAEVAESWADEVWGPPKDEDWDA